MVTAPVAPVTLPIETTVLDSLHYTRDGRRDPYETVHRWHDDNHPGVFRWCREQPCDALHR